MKRSKEIIVASIILWLGVFSNLQAFGQEWRELENEVWKIEERYWTYWIESDIESLMTLLHKDFIGWPSSSKMPSDKKAARAFVENLLSQTKLIAFELKPAVIKIIGDVAVVHYFLDLKDSEGNKIGSTYRITHTWLKQDGNWQVIGGMSSE